MRRMPTIVVAGAGIGGLTAALALAGRGFHVVVLERAATLSEAGAGIQLSPNAGRVLAGLGLDAAIAAEAVEPVAIEIRLGRTGSRLATLPLRGLSRRYGAPYRTIHRADLQAVLVAAVERHAGIELLSGHEMVAFSAHARGVTAMAETVAGSAEFVGSALIAAEGIRSPTRAMMPGGSPLQPAARTAWRAVVPGEAAAEANLGRDRIGLWIGPDAHLVAYPLRGGREVNLVAILPSGFGPLPESGSWSAPGEPERLQRSFGRWARPVRTLLAMPEAWRCWPIATVHPGGAWVRGAVALLGDAAHGLPPYLAQGGAMAIEDGAVLAAQLAATPEEAPAALLRYQAARRPRVLRAYRASRSAGDLYHMGALTGTVRNIGIAAMGGRLLLARYGWLYRWQA